MRRGGDKGADISHTCWHGKVKREMGEMGVGEEIRSNIWKEEMGARVDGGRVYVRQSNR